MIYTHEHIYNTILKKAIRPNEELIWKVLKKMIRNVFKVVKTFSNMGEVQMKVNLRLSLTPVRRTWLEKKNQLTVGEDAEKQIPNLLLVGSKLL